jgi:hypothetical protein
MIAGHDAVRDRAVEDPVRSIGRPPFLFNIVVVLNDVAEMDDELNVVGYYPIIDPLGLTNVRVRMQLGIKLGVGQNHDGEVGLLFCRGNGDWEKKPDDGGSQ